jgi:glutamate dehydrogenase
LVNHGVESDSLENDIAAYQEHTAPLYRQLNGLLAGPDAERVSARREEFLDLGMGEELAAWYAELFESFSLLDIAALARAHGMDSHIVAEVYYAVYADFDADSLLNHITNLPREDKWQALARGAQRDELYFALHEITQSILTTTDSQQDPQRRLDEWKQANASSLERAERLSAEVRDHEFSMASITVLLRHLRGLVGA